MTSQFKGLSEASVRAALMKSSVRALASLPAQLVALIALTLSVPAYRHRPWMHFGIAIFILLAGARYAFWKLGEKIYSGPHGLMRWRVLFGLNMIPVGLVWSIQAALNFRLDGFTASSFISIMICNGLAAMYIPAYGFDLENTLIFLVAIGGPIILIGPGGPVITLCIGLYFLFIIMDSFSSHKAQVAILQNLEKIEEQRQSLALSNFEISKAQEVINSMLESINEAFLIIDIDGTCKNTASAKAKEYLGFDPQGESLVEILGLQGKEAANFNIWFANLVSEKFPFSEQVNRGPRLIESRRKGLFLSLGFQPMRNADGSLRAVILNATDVTGELQARRLAALSAERAELILRIHENAQLFRSFLRDFECAMADLASWPEADLSVPRRTLHTLKGAAGMFGAQSLAAAVLRAEVQVRNLTETNELTSERFREVIRNLKEEFGRFMTLHENMFAQLGVYEDEAIDVPVAKLENLKSEFESSESELQAYLKLKAKLMASDLAEQLQVLRGQVENASMKLGKPVNLQIISHTGESIPMPHNCYREVFRSWVHLINNSIDHGIEPREIRMAAGKDEAGLITVLFERHAADNKRWLRFLISDDGGGIDLAKLREAARARGQELPQEELQAMQSIFVDGVSTKGQVTDLSGMGIGMGAVRAAVLKARGKIRVVRSDSTGTQFEILLPDKSLEARLPQNPPRSLAS